MKEYETAEMEIIRFSEREAADIITTSGSWTPVI